MKTYQEVGLETLNAGAIRELFEDGWRKLLTNIGDSNTAAEKTRSLTIKVEVRPSKTRELAVTKVSIMTSLAPIRPSESIIFLDGDGMGGVQAYTSDPKQLSLELENIHPLKDKTK